MSSYQLVNESASLSLSPKFILPENQRPKLSEVTSLASIPIIDLSDHSCYDDSPSSSLLVQKISQACEEYGFFQIVNHGVPEQVCNKMMTAMTDFFNLPTEQKEHLSTTDLTKNIRLTNYFLQVEGGGKVKMWSESFCHPWDPIDDVIHLLPQKIATQYREAFTDYAREIGSLIRRLLSLISMGLGIEEDYLLKILGDQPRVRAHGNFYPPCPDPELTLGLHEHTDINALTVLLQSQVSGLQVIKDGKWVAVPAIPNSFVINLGDQIEVLSNGRFKSVHHRAVTNKVLPRVSMAMFYGPNMDTVIGPIDDLIDEEHPPRYRKYRFSEFLEKVFSQEGTKVGKEVFELPY
ncbi:protein DMR6-LIKE OXYGENASE 1-like [Gastrolobium bilobum]|uniref:protein DMR6-LIKE OXYGENASE 1-like n=1 Tax=Gastrolobium bilobum TaxID=150636 RepID=UPI002AB01D7B|nr:protein DMR6-LIKE OXYGENASE 1-like [Gastrolobium bilobum]